NRESVAPPAPGGNPTGQPPTFSTDRARRGPFGGSSSKRRRSRSDDSDFLPAPPRSACPATLPSKAAASFSLERPPTSSLEPRRAAPPDSNYPTTGERPKGGQALHLPFPSSRREVTRCRQTTLKRRRQRLDPAPSSTVARPSIRTL